MKTMQGIVTSTKRTKTITVEITSKWQHPLYKKLVKRSKKYSCHNENIDVKDGDKVLIEECRKISKNKYFKLVKKLEK